MTRADNTPFLARAAAARRQDTLSKATEAIERLDKSGRQVTFSAVAAAAGISRTWLYRNPGTRDLINRLRSEPRSAASTKAAQRATAESLRARLDAAHEEINRLRAENATLREQAARHLGQQRAGQRSSRP
jgi:uncharacterized protein DUF6262